MLYGTRRARKLVVPDKLPVVFLGVHTVPGKRSVAESFFDEVVRVDVVVFRTDRHPVVHGQLDRVPDVQPQGVGDQEGRGPGQTVGHQVRVRPGTVDRRIFRELRRELVPENVERNGDVRRHGDDVRQQAGRGPGEKRKGSVRLLHGVQHDRVRGPEKLRSDGGRGVVGQQGLRDCDAVQCAPQDGCQYGFVETFGIWKTNGTKR